MNEVVETLRDLSGIFERLELPYAAIGEIAVGVYGIPRLSSSVDLVVAVVREQLPELCAVMEGKGFTVPDDCESGSVDSCDGMPVVRFRCYV